MCPISSNHFSHDEQVLDALNYLRVRHVDAYCTVRRDFPENIVFDGGWFNTEAMDVEPEWSSWLADAIEATGLVTWEDGEPWAV